MSQSDHGSALSQYAHNSRHLHRSRDRVQVAGTLGYVGLWARRELAEAAVGPDATYFDAPVLIL